MVDFTLPLRCVCGSLFLSVCAAYVAICLPTFRDSLSVLSSGVKQSKKQKKG